MQDTDNLNRGSEDKSLSLSLAAMAAERLEWFWWLEDGRKRYRAFQRSVGIWHTLPAHFAVSEEMAANARPLPFAPHAAEASETVPENTGGC